MYGVGLEALQRAYAALACEAEEVAGGLGSCT